MADKRLGEILVEAGKASPEDVQRALDLQSQVGGRVGQLMVAMGIVAEEVLVEALSRQLHVPKVSLRGKTAGPGLTGLIPAEFARQRKVLPVALSRPGGKEVLYIATSDPTDRSSMQAISEATGREVVPLLAAHDELMASIDRSYAAPEGDLSEGIEPGASAAVHSLPESLREADRGALLDAVIALLLRKGLVTEAEILEALRHR